MGSRSTRLHALAPVISQKRNLRILPHPPVRSPHIGETLEKDIVRRCWYISRLLEAIAKD